MRSDARPANLAHLRKVLLQKVLEDIHGPVGQCGSLQCGGPASAGQTGICADAPLRRNAVSDSPNVITRAVCASSSCMPRHEEA